MQFLHSIRISMKFREQRIDRRPRLGHAWMAKGLLYNQLERMGHAAHVDN
jgi:hypothetical protein